MDSYARYDGTNDSYQSGSVSLSKSVAYQSESYGNKIAHNGYFYYDHQTYIFEIPKMNYKYLYVGPPNLWYYNNYYMLIENFNPSPDSPESEGNRGNGGSEIVQKQKEGGLSVGGIIGIVIAIVIVISGLIIFFFIKRSRRKDYISTPTTEYKPPISPAVPK